MEEKKLTGYPSIDKPWLKYYSEEAINAPLPECTMYEFVWQNNKDYLSDVALRYYGTKISYGKLFQYIKRAAAAFFAMGVRAGDIVTIMSMHTPETIISIYALNYLGAVANLVYMTLSPKEVMETLHNTESKMLLILDVALDKVIEIGDEIGVPVVVQSAATSMSLGIKLGYKFKTKLPKHNFTTWKSFLSKGDHLILREPEHDHERAAVIVYTSGTTGAPKGVVLSNDAMNAFYFQDQNILDFKRQWRFLMAIPPFIGFGVTMILLILNLGLCSTLWLDTNAQSIADEYFKLKPELFIGGPVFIDSFLKHSPVDLKHIKLFAGGGGALLEAKEKAINTLLKQSNADVLYASAYGMTETSTLCYPVYNHHKEKSVGVPLPRTNIKVVDVERRQELTYGETGELLFSSPNLMTAYYRMPKETREVITIDENETRWLHTGDLGMIDTDGFVYITGRIKRIYPIKGKDNTIYRLFPQRLEEFFIEQNNVERCGVIVKEDAEMLNKIVVFVSLSDYSQDKKSTLQRLISSCRQNLPEHLQPAEVHILDFMPMTQSGKIDYRLLEERAAREYQQET